MDHSVNVLHFAEARAREIASLMKEINTPERAKKKTWFQNLPHHLRRRGASQNPKRVPKNLRVSNQNAAAKPSSKGKKHKKQPKDLKAEYAKRSKPDSTWLESHIWHAKRFKMKTLWGYQLPINSNDRKQGSSHEAATNRAMIQDLSYYCCIELAGIQEKLLEHLSVITDALAGHTFASEMFLDGSKEGYSFLYHPKSCPYKAIGPVSFIWKPVLDDKTNEYKLEIPGDSMRRLWIWCHPTFHDELVQVLMTIFDFKETTISDSDVCNVSGAETGNIKKEAETANPLVFSCKLNFTKTERHFRKEKVFFSNGIKMVLRKNTLVRHRLIGPMSQSILTQVLRPADVSDSSFHSNESLNGNSAKKFKANDSSESSVANVTDRVSSSQSWWEAYYESDYHKHFYTNKGELLSNLKDTRSSYYVTPRSVIGLTVRDPRIDSGWRQHRKNTNSSSEDVSYDFSEIDQLLTPEMADSALWEDDIRNEVTATKLSDQEINNERSNSIGAIDLGKRESRVPIIIIHQCGSNGFGSGWDFIAPLGWSMEFWISFERKGGRPAGLRDLHFINLEAGRPSFPCSFPDTDAGAAYEESIRLEALTEYYKHPKSKRPNFFNLGISTPFFMCWKTLIKDWEKEIANQEIVSLFPSVKGLFMTNGSGSDYLPSCDGQKEYYVLRQKELRQLSSLCGRLSKVPRRGIAQELMEKLTKDWNAFVMSVQPHVQFSRSLIVLKVHCLNKGRPSTHSGIYLLNKADLMEIKNNPQFCGPIEPCHSSGKKPQVETKSLERPHIDSLISVSSRKMVGYVSEGGYSSLCGKGSAIGHCSSVGFLLMLRQCLEAQLRPLVLVREQHGSKYRIANVEIIEHYQ